MSGDGDTRASPSQWPESLDAMIAAPGHHEILDSRTLGAKPDKGRTLWSAALAAFALALASQVAAAAETLATPECKLNRIASVDFAFKDLAFIPVQVNGHPGAMVLDTASAFSVLWWNAISDLRLPTHLTMMVGTEEFIQLAYFKSLVIGNVTFSKGTFVRSTRPSDAPREPPIGPVFGTLGMDVFAHVDFELDFARKKLNLYSQEHCPGKVVYWADAYSEAPMHRGTLGNLYFPMELDGKKIQATVSTGSLMTSLTTDLTRKLYGFDERSSDIEVEEDSSGGPAAHYRAMMLTAEGLKVTSTRIRLIPPQPACWLHPDRQDRAFGYGNECTGTYPLKLGLNVLQKLHLYFATKEQVLYFTPADASK